MNEPPSPRPCVRAFVAFGANLGDPATAFADARERIAALPGTRIVCCSSLYRTTPLGVSDQPDYTNAVIEIETRLGAAELLGALLDIEHQGGRTRVTHHAPRIVDLDLLLYDEHIISAPGLEVPHPRMHRRAFVLVPLAEIAPEVSIPGRGRVAALLPRVADQAVHRLSPRS
jgi:2-amino-4-hydroxy-6-hydroxymethyldihydropteridine diphosphokinase